VSTTAVVEKLLAAESRRARTGEATTAAVEKLEETESQRRRKSGTGVAVARR